MDISLAVAVLHPRIINNVRNVFLRKSSIINDVLLIDKIKGIIKKILYVLKASYTL